MDKTELRALEDSGDLQNDDGSCKNCGSFDCRPSWCNSEYRPDELDIGEF